MREIDAYIWLNLASNVPVPETRMFWLQNNFRDKIRELLEAD